MSRMILKTSERIQSASTICLLTFLIYVTHPIIKKCFLAKVTQKQVIEFKEKHQSKNPFMFAATTHNNNILHKTFPINTEKVQEKKK